MPCVAGDILWTDNVWGMYKMESRFEFIIKNLLEDFSFKMSVKAGDVEVCDIAPPPELVIQQVLTLAKK
jgi:hypothetical protein